LFFNINGATFSSTSKIALKKDVHFQFVAVHSFIANCFAKAGWLLEIYGNLLILFIFFSFLQQVLPVF
jgi:hypothetical protein